MTDPLSDARPETFTDPDAVVAEALRQFDPAPTLSDVQWEHLRETIMRRVVAVAAQNRDDGPWWTSAAQWTPAGLPWAVAACLLLWILALPPRPVVTERAFGAPAILEDVLMAETSDALGAVLASAEDADVWLRFAFEAR